MEIVVQAVDTSGNVSGPSNTVLFTDCPDASSTYLRAPIIRGADRVPTIG